MNKSAFAIVVGLCLVGLTAWAGPSLWRAHHQGSSCCGLVSFSDESCCAETSCCEATSPTCEASAATCSAGSLACCEGSSAMVLLDACCESPMPCTEPGDRFVSKPASKGYPVPKPLSEIE